MAMFYNIVMSPSGREVAHSRMHAPTHDDHANESNTTLYLFDSLIYE